MKLLNPILIAGTPLSLEAVVQSVDNLGRSFARSEMLPPRHGTHEWFEQQGLEGTYVPPFLRIRHAELDGPLLQVFDHIPIQHKRFFFFIFTADLIDVFVATLRRLATDDMWLELREHGDRGKRIAVPITQFLTPQGIEQMRRSVC